ncbi:hypothetical protein H2200_004032 [Cladophialophora chaetospira]|uniref:Uncharacterized protein n=1 Tax=Cladophialophora chaetospira TaxID=386627 RepID=A0AA38XFC6_9EURO|nr:hypothetical protein H2200_004032 [Cladophialophora chaetospira]
MCAPENVWDEMYYHPESQQFRDAVTSADLNASEETYIPAVPMRATQQREMRPLPPPRRMREEIYSPPEHYNPEVREFETLTESIEAVLGPDHDDGTDLIDSADRNVMVGETAWPATPTIQDSVLPSYLRDYAPNGQNDDIDQDEDAWNDIMADFPTSVEDCPLGNNPISSDEYLPRETHSAVVAGARGTTASNPGGVGQSVPIANQAACTLLNRCSRCVGLSYLDRLEVHPGLSQAYRFPYFAFGQGNGESGQQNSLLANLVSESEPIGGQNSGGQNNGRLGGPSIWADESFWGVIEEPVSRHPRGWGAIGESVPRQPRRWDVQALRAMWAE